METSQTEVQPQPNPPERGRAWRIVAIVLALHAALQRYLEASCSFKVAARAKIQSQAMLRIQQRLQKIRL
jgi:hypothetical protein